MAYNPSMELFTVGYEGMDIDEFTYFLKKNKIQLVADLRKNPVSRKKGFSKNKMAENLATRKIQYLHLGKLGTPTTWRKQQKEGRLSRKKMFQQFVDQVIPNAQEDIDLLKTIMREKRTALLCFEADATDCHRSFVAHEIVKQEKRAKHKVEIVNLMPENTKQLRMF